MKIEHIKFTNYRQYKDAEIKFAYRSKDKNFNVIQGTNGAGKTNLLNGITWCLYGEEIHPTEKNLGYDIVNDITINEAKFNKPCRVQVEIKMRDKNDTIYIISREAFFIKIKKGKSSIINCLEMRDSQDGFTKLLVSIEKIIDGQTKITNYDYPETFIRRVIPQSIKQYFFFDGEQLRSFLKEASSEKVKNAIFDISQLTLIEQVIKHLTAARRDFEKVVKKDIPETGPIVEQLDQSRRLQKEYKEKLNKIIHELKEARRNKEHLEGKIKDVPSSTIQALQKERKNIESNQATLTDRLNEIKSEKNEYLKELATYVLSYNAIQKTQDLILEKRKRKEIPPPITPDFIKNLLKKGECICGTNIKGRNNEQRNRIEGLLKEVKLLPAFSAAVLELERHLNNCSDKLKLFTLKLDEYNKRIKGLKEQLEKNDNRLEEIGTRLKKSNIEQVRLWERDIEEYNRSIEKSLEEKAELNEKLRIEKKREAELKNEHIRAIKKEKKYENHLNFLEFCQDALKELEDIKRDIMKEIRLRVEGNTEKQYLELTWKKEKQKVVIDEEYNISIKDKFDKEIIATLSAGEKLILILSFMAALNNVSGFDVPIIIDTLFGRLDKEMRENIANKLPNYLRDRQVILLALGTEYTPEVKKIMSKAVGKEYRIDFQEEKNGSKANLIEVNL